uniref:Inositol-pentakisphosphate 2-kinase n=1 Tax=Setaria digitata TaxID=48799 RepID=A0A915PNK2_9BILA
MRSYGSTLTIADIDGHVDACPFTTCTVLLSPASMAFEVKPRIGPNLLKGYPLTDPHLPSSLHILDQKQSAYGRSLLRCVLFKNSSTATETVVAMLRSSLFNKSAGETALVMWSFAQPLYDIAIMLP